MPARRRRGKAVPVPTPETQPYWDGAAAGELRIQRCRRLRRAVLLPAPDLPVLRIGRRRVVHRQRAGDALLLRHQPPARARLRGRRALRDRRGPAGGGTADDDQHGRACPPPRRRWCSTCRCGSRSSGAATSSLPVFTPARARRQSMSNAGVIIAGAAETDEIGRLPEHSTLGLHIEAARNAVADAGLTMRDIDGIATVSAPGPGPGRARARHLPRTGSTAPASAAPRSCCTSGTRSPRSGPATRRRS